MMVGSVVKLLPEMADRYLALHADPWPDVIRAIEAANFRNYVIYLRRPEMLLFSSLDYVGSDLPADQARLADDPAIQRWWRETEPCQEPLASAADGELWAPMTPIFHCAQEGKTR